jgi:hypothetical protein
MPTTAVQESWFAAAPGRSLNYDGHYGLQCVDAVDAYAEDIFGAPWETCVGGVGGANQLLDAAPDAYWTRIDNDPNNPALIPQRGDVVVYGGDDYNQFGHTAVVLEATLNGVLLLQQDGFAAPLQFVDGNWYSNKPAHLARLAYYQPGTGPMLGWLRPRPDKVKGGTITVQSTTIKPAPAPAPEQDEDMPTLKRIPAITRKPGATKLGKDKTWYLKDKTGRANLNIAQFGPGLYDGDVFVQGTGLAPGEVITVNFIIVTKGKRSGYWSQDAARGTRTGKFRGSARLSGLVVAAGQVVEVSVTSSATGPDLTTYGADLKLWN